MRDGCAESMVRYMFHEAIKELLKSKENTNIYQYINENYLQGKLQDRKIHGQFSY